MIHFRNTLHNLGGLDAEYQMRLLSRNLDIIIVVGALGNTLCNNPDPRRLSRFLDVLVASQLCLGSKLGPALQDKLTSFGQPTRLIRDLLTPN